jgi:hypothetical protein
MVAGKDHNVDMRRCLDDPIELAEIVVKVGNEEAPHRRRRRRPTGHRTSTNHTISPQCPVELPEVLGPATLFI